MRSLEHANGGLNLIKDKMAQSKIEWTEKVWNPVIGCSKVSAGCKNCYAETMSNRLAMMGGSLQEDTWAAYSEILRFDYDNPKYPNGLAKGFNGKIKIMYDRISQPLHWKKPSMIFVNSMSELFHEKISFNIIDSIFANMEICKQHTFQILTKRPQRAIEYFKWRLSQYPQTYDNVWLGVSVENQATANERIPLLLQTPATVRWISVEPMLEKIKIRNTNIIPLKFSWLKSTGIDWVVVGCESGHNRRECKLEWVEDIIEQCKQANVPAFVKQIQIKGIVEKNIENFPEHLQIRQYPLNNLYLL